MKLELKSELAQEKTELAWVLHMRLWANNFTGLISLFLMCIIGIVRSLKQCCGEDSL